MSTDNNTIAGKKHLPCCLQKHVCIASIGHCGSTLLGMLLDQNPEITAIGELKNFVIYARDPQRTCSCGVPILECNFWLSVQDRLRDNLGDESLDLVSYVQVPTFDKRGFRKLPKLTDLLLLLGSPRLRTLVSPLSNSLAGELAYGKSAIAVYDAVASLQNTPIVVDSPTTATYTKVVYLADPDRCLLIDLVRDGRGWACSMLRREGVEMEFAARLWARRRWNMKMVLATIPRRKILRLRYEDLCLDPAASVRKTAEFLGIGKQNMEFKLRKRDFHGVGGNPMRFRYDEVDIKLDEKWREELSAEDLRTFERIAGKQNRRLGYE